MIRCYFAYGSNMNPGRVRARGLRFDRLEGATLSGYRLEFAKYAADHPGSGHASIAWDPAERVEGVLYWLSGAAEILTMDAFERAPVNYSRDVVVVDTAGGTVSAWTYFANPAVLRAGLAPERDYLEHLLCGAPYLSPRYLSILRGWPVAAGQ
jgi:gamma-glutamylcyclotransferase (GGCT)/AIG2-like uncharacterized protein YtfP